MNIYNIEDNTITTTNLLNPTSELIATESNNNNNNIDDNNRKQPQLSSLSDEQIITKRPCYYHNTDPNVWIFNSTDQRKLINWSLPLAHDSLILIRCRDIGKYQQSGPRELLCRDSVWTNLTTEIQEFTTCTGLNQEFDYDSMFINYIFFILRVYKLINY